MKINKKLVLMILMFLGVIIFFSNNCFASEPFGKNAVEKYISTSHSELGRMENDENTQIPPMMKLFGAVIYMLQLGGMAIAILFLIFISIKFILSSVDERAQIKQHLVTYFFGVVILFAASGLLGLIRKLIIGNVYNDDGTLR